MDNEKERISVEEAANILGIRPVGVRTYMRKGLLDIGLALSPKKTGKKVWTYIVFKKKVYALVGKREESR